MSLPASLPARTRRALLVAVGLTVALMTDTVTRERGRDDDRGLSQSTENAILLAGAVAVATIVIALITAYVRGKLTALK